MSTDIALHSNGGDYAIKVYPDSSDEPLQSDTHLLSNLARISMDRAEYTFTVVYSNGEKYHYSTSEADWKHVNTIINAAQALYIVNALMPPI